MALISPLEQCQLPDDYEYNITSYDQKEGSNCTLSFRIKNIKTSDEVLKWLKEYEEKSKFTWRISRKVKALGKFNVVRYDYRCQHNVPKPNVGAKLSKNTDCPAIMKIVVKRFLDAPGLRKVDKETKMFPCEVDLRHWHNHPSNSAFVLRFRDMSAATREKLLHYFQIGHTAASARHALQNDLLLENPTNGPNLLADSSLLPSLSKVHHLLHSTFGAEFAKQNRKKEIHIWKPLTHHSTFGAEFAKQNRKKEIHIWKPLTHHANTLEHSDNPEISNCSSLPENGLSLMEIEHENGLSLMEIEHEISLSLPENVVEISSSLPENKHDNNKFANKFPKTEIFHSNCTVSKRDKEDVKKSFEEWYRRISYGLEHNSQVYVPAIKTMLSNNKRYASTEIGLVSALYNFAKHKGPCAQSIRYCKRKRNQISTANINRTVKGKAVC